ncbi:SRPBCC family protein [Candidatus Mycobacterium wuenschmannii]|uniref:SRPBCC family protein n=1 Tax=Candidatus Mycobacterium wuenschmannii TaxID=3027808 RepID=A0ABY8VUM3_9MYCO|nr:SRPBCC family protein [Candidatus Mycobacterium wuenschmannii]WIM86741.1 SRPBCC family protein [Candidatus Mycobacterium wuenschmannii]
MARILTVSDTVDIDATPESLYAMVSDPTRIPDWSPENRGATVLNPADDGAAFVGMTFEGRNKRGRAKWVTRCTVTDADPGRKFAFTVHAIGVRTPRIKAPNASWEYLFEPIGEGTTRVTETWTDDRTSWPDPVVAVFDRIVTSGKTFPEFQRTNIRKTLDSLKRATEAKTA